MPGTPEGSTHLGAEDNFYDQQPFRRVVAAAIRVDTERQTAPGAEKVIFSEDRYRYGISHIVNGRYGHYAAGPDDGATPEVPQTIRERNYQQAGSILRLPRAHKLFQGIEVSGDAFKRARTNFSNNIFSIIQALDGQSPLWDIYVHTQREPSGYNHYGVWGTNKRTTRQPTPTYESWVGSQLLAPRIDQTLLDDARATGKRRTHRNYFIQRNIN